jgi:hypothetical protein
MDRKNIGIGVLAITALVLLVACLWQRPAQAADFAVKDRDFQMVTAPGQDGSDSLYIIDNRTGRLVVFGWDVRAHSLVPLAVRDAMDAFR